MKTLLNALKDGRLIELPDNHKEKALQILASLIEAIPDLKAGSQVVESVLARERDANTALGMGWACPHARTANEGDILCAVGWSPAGIDYGAPDGQPVRVVVMYYVPDAQKNAYLKEISGLVRVLRKLDSRQELESARDLDGIRNKLLDIIGAAMETDVPEARARMVRLEARHAAATAGTAWPTQIVPFSVILAPGRSPLVLAQDRDLLHDLEASLDWAALLPKQAQLDVGGYRIVSRASQAYQLERVLYDCLALRLPANPPPPPASLPRK